MKRRLTIVLAVMGLFASAGIAAAADEDPEDTVFNYGYDSDNHVLVWGAQPTDALYDCTIEVDGNLTSTYVITEDGLVVVDELHEGDAVVTFTPTPEVELAEDFEGEAATEDADYPGPNEDCLVSGGVVEGPNGQVNHGMVMKLFNSIYEGPNRGCVVRYLAQSDFGNPDNGQVNVPDVDPDAEPLETGDTGEIDFESVLADCERGNSDEGDRLTGPENATAKKAAALDRARGNSGEAPGRSGDSPGNSGQAPGKNK